jgi:hypothetical protein
MRGAAVGRGVEDQEEICRFKSIAEARKVLSATFDVTHVDMLIAALHPPPRRETARGLSRGENHAEADSIPDWVFRLHGSRFL